MSDDDLKPADGDAGAAQRPVVDPESITAAAAEQPASKRRRATGSRRSAAGSAKVKVEGHTLDLSRIEGMLVGLHALAAHYAKTPELEVSRPEMHDWLENVKAVARHYEVELAQKTVDWTTLIFSTGVIWGSRAVAITIRTEAEKQRRTGTGRVVPFPVSEATPITPVPDEVQPEPAA